MALIVYYVSLLDKRKFKVSLNARVFFSYTIYNKLHTVMQRIKQEEKQKIEQNYLNDNKVARETNKTSLYTGTYAK